jgi:hypothetical protein
MEPEGSLPQSQVPPPHVPVLSQLDLLIKLAYSKYISLFLLHSSGTLRCVTFWSFFEDFISTE